MLTVTSAGANAGHSCESHLCPLCEPWAEIERLKAERCSWCGAAPGGSGDGPGTAERIARLEADLEALRKTDAEILADQIRKTAERDTARGLCVDLEGELARLRELMNGLCSDAGELLRGWDARKSQRRIGGMGSNIATEDAGRLTSIYYWERLRTAVKAARAALGHAEQGEG